MTLEDINKKIDDYPFFSQVITAKEMKIVAKLFADLAWSAGQKAAVQESIDLMKKILNQ